ncbi:MAG: sensor histidine kinase [Candidatus Binatia bacterium]
MHRVPLDLAVVVRGQVGDLAVLASDTGLSLRCEVEEHARVLFDEYCLSQALTNLIQNGIKFTRHGSVVVRLYRDGERLRISVRDTGIGIGAPYLERLFEPLSQEDSGLTRRFEGSGLGLALTRRYLELNGARLSVENKKDVGSVFTIEFPAECELSPELTARAAG